MSDNLPKFHLNIIDLKHEGVKLFMAHYSKYSCSMKSLYQQAHSILYNAQTAVIPGKTFAIFHPKSITIDVRPYERIESMLCEFEQDEERVIHFNANYFVMLSKMINETPASKVDEDGNSSIMNSKEVQERNEGFFEHLLKGLLLHGIVHAIQFNGNLTCPRLVTEGIADWVRIKADLIPPWWKPEYKEGKDWDAGFESTGYFFKWLDEVIEGNSNNIAPTLNQVLSYRKWDDGEAMAEALQLQEKLMPFNGMGVNTLWKLCQEITKTKTGYGKREGESSEEFRMRELFRVMLKTLNE